MFTNGLFRSRERYTIHKAITDQENKLVEVFGPPMVGKSVLIEQVVHDVQSLDQSSDEPTIYHKFWCKNIYVLQDLFIEIVQKLAPNRLFAANSDSYEMNFILKLIKRIVTRSIKCRHIFVFHKCEGFHINGTRFAFLSFLGEMVNMFQTTQCKVHIVFSTFKRFSLSGHKTRRVNVGMLIKQCDIICLLSHYAPGVNVNCYVPLCQRYLCLPKLIVQVAISHISQNAYTGEELEQFLCKDLSFYSDIFNTRYMDVYNWLTKSELELTATICGTGFNPFNKDDVESLTVFYGRGDKTYQSLRDSLVIEAIDHSDQLIVHPLVCYKCSLDRPVNERNALYKTNSFQKFIGHVMMKAETNIEKHGTRGQTYGCHRLEWPYIRQLFQRAISGDFKDILRVAVVARRLIMVLYPNEAKQFYTGLFETTTQSYRGSPSEAAVMEACLGHIMASGAGVNFESALQHLNSALDTLKYHGPTFFYKWALRRKAIILYRMSRYPKSTKYFQKAKAITGCVPLSPGDHEVLSVSLLQTKEDDIIGDIYEAIPMIFTGDNENALNKLLLINETIHDRYENHPDLDVLLNNIGLALQRGFADLHGALRWYTKSLKHRSLLIRINPQLMLVTLNNVAMIKLQIGDLVGAESDLQTAITIIREGIWYHYNTALTLTSLAEIKGKLGKFQEAYDSLLKADEILQKIFKNNDYRLKINLLMFHYKLLLNQTNFKVSETDSMSSDIDKMVDLGFSINKNMSVDSHHHLMSIYEHGMAVNWGVSVDKVSALKNMLLRHVEENAMVKEVLEKPDLLPGQQSVLQEHRHFLDYIKNTEMHDLKLEKLLDHLKKSCVTCKLINNVLEKEMWLNDHLQEKARQANEIGKMLLYNVNSRSESARKKRIAFYPMNLNIIDPSHFESSRFVIINVSIPSYYPENFNMHSVLNPSFSFLDHNVVNMSRSFYEQIDLNFLVNNPSLVSERSLLSCKLVIANPSMLFESNSPTEINPFLSDVSGLLDPVNPSILCDSFSLLVANPSISFGPTSLHVPDIFYRQLSSDLNSTHDQYYLAELGSLQNEEAGNASYSLVHHYMNPSSLYSRIQSLPLNYSALLRIALENIYTPGGQVCQEHHGESFHSNPVYCLGSGMFRIDEFAQRGDDGACPLTVVSEPPIDNAARYRDVSTEHLHECVETDSS